MEISQKVEQHKDLDVDDNEMLVVVSNVGPSPIPISVSSEGISASAVRRLQSLKRSFRRQPFPANVSAKELTSMSQEGKERLRQWLKSELEAISGYDSGLAVSEYDSGQSIPSSPTEAQPKNNAAPCLASWQPGGGGKVSVPDPLPSSPKTMNVAVDDKSTLVPGPICEPIDPRKIRSSSRLINSPGRIRISLNRGKKKKEEAADPIDTTRYCPPQTHLKPMPVQTAKRRSAAQIPRTEEGGVSRNLASEVTSSSPTSVDTQPSITAGPNSQHPDHNRASYTAQQVVDRAIALLHHIDEWKEQPNFTTGATALSPDQAAIIRLCQALKLSRCLKDLVDLLGDLQGLVNPMIETTTLQFPLGILREAKKDANPTTT